MKKCNLLEPFAARECALDERLAVAEAVDLFDASVAAGALRLEGVRDGFENDLEESEKRWDHKNTKQTRARRSPRAGASPSADVVVDIQKELAQTKLERELAQQEHHPKPGG